MKRAFIKVILSTLFSIALSSSAWNQAQIDIHIPTVEEETDYIWRNIQDIAFFEAHNYELTFPEGALIDSLLSKSKANQLTQHDYEQLKAFMQLEVYNVLDYSNAFKKIEKQVPLVDSMVNQLLKLNRDWNFIFFNPYRIQLTLYGSGGSYDPDTGNIIIFATKDGAFKQYNNPANTLIHEIVHIGIEESIIQKYNVPHPLKERIVDTIVLLHFGSLLPEYKLQQMGDTRLDQYLKNKADLDRLDKIVADILK